MKRMIGFLLSLVLLLAAVPVSAATLQETDTRSLHDTVTAVPDALTDTGFIFYPGAFVDYRSYNDMLEKLAENGILAVSTEFPFDFAMTDPIACYRVMEQHPEIEHWFIGGHSQGGAAATMNVAIDWTRFDGVILFGSFSMFNMNLRGVPTLSIYGSEDGVLVKPMYNLFKFNIAKDLDEHVIEGGNHAQFGDYGNQFLDGTATISGEEQVDETVSAIVAFIDRVEA